MVIASSGQVLMFLSELYELCELCELYELYELCELYVSMSVYMLCVGVFFLMFCSCEVARFCFLEVEPKL